MKRRLRLRNRRAHREAPRHDCVHIIRAGGYSLAEHVVAFHWRSGRRVIERCLPLRVAEAVIANGNATGRREYGWFRTTGLPRRAS